MNYSNMTERETEIELSTSVSEGLKSFTAHERLIDNGRNLPEKTYAKSVWSVLFSQFTNLYTVAFIVMGAIGALVDVSVNKNACIIFFAVAVINMVSGFLRDSADYKIAKSFDERRSGEVKIIRDGEERKIDPQLLVKGDLVLLEEGDFVPCDLRILSCTDMKVDESIFTGSFVPCDKKSERSDDEDDFSGCDNMLYSGTSIVSGSGRAAVVRAGGETTLAKLVEQRSKKIDTHDKFAKNTASEKILVCVSVVFAIITMIILGAETKDFAFAIMSACTVGLCLMPAPVSIIRMGAVKFYTLLLEKKGVRFEKGESVTALGDVSYLIFDKGGVLTNGELTLEEAAGDEVAFEMAVLCSDCRFVQNSLKGSDIDKALFKAAEEKGIDAKSLIDRNYKLMEKPFDERQRLMASIIHHNDGYRLIVKGAIDVIPTLCSHIKDGEKMLEMSGEMLHRLERVSSSMAERALKIRAVAYRDLEFLPENIDDAIKNMTFAGAFGFREIMGRGAKEAIKKLRSVFVRPVMVTGDYEVTASTFARHAALIKKEQDCVNFRELAECSDEELLAACGKYSVFSGATVEDRKRIVKVLSQSGLPVAVAGDEMASHSVGMYANTVFANEKNTGDVKVEEASIKNVADAVYTARCMRNNIAESTSLVISAGLLEVLVMMYTLFAGKEFLFTTIGMLAVNLFIVLLPCLFTAFFASVKIDTKNRREIGIKCIVRGLIAAVMCILFDANPMMYFAIFAIFEACRICASYHNLDRNKMGLGAVIGSIVTFIFVLCMAQGEFMGIFTAEKMMMTIVASILAVGINAVISNIKVKGN